MCSHVLKKGEEMVRHYGYYSKKILKHLGLWDVKARPPPRANWPPESSEQYVDYSDSQIPVSDGHLYMDMDYPESVIS